MTADSSLLSPLNESEYDLLLEVEAVDDRLDGVTCRGVYYSDFEDAIFINFIFDYDFLLAFYGRCNASNNDLSDLVVVFCLRLVTFKYFNGKICLVVFVRLKSVLLFAWYNAIALYDSFVDLLVPNTFEQPTQESLFFDCMRNLHANRQWCNVI